MPQLSFPANPTNGQEYTDPNNKVWQFDGVKWQIAVSEEIKQFSGAKLLVTSPISLTATNTSLDFSNASYNVGNFWNSTSPSIIRIPRNGYYRINFRVEAGTEGAGNSYNTILYINDAADVSSDLAANQTVVYDEIRFFNSGDRLSIYGSEANGLGTFTTNTYFEISLVGYTFGTPIIPGYEFSGIKLDLFSDVSTTTTTSSIAWTTNDIQYNTNANSAGAVYWTNASPTRLTIATNGYYRIQSTINTDVEGAANSYNIILRKNGTSIIESSSIGPLDNLQLDEIYYFNNAEYLQLVVSNTGNVGKIKAGTTLSITRMGV